MKLPLSFKMRRRDRTRLLIGLGLLALGLASLPGLVTNAQRWSRLTATIAHEAEINEQLQAKAQAAAERDTIARERFKSCLFVKDPTKNTLVAIAPGLRSVDTETGLPLAPGTVVCSIDGNTGIVGPDGYVQDIAFTGDRSVVRQAVARAGIQFVDTDRKFGSSNRTYQEPGK